MSVTKDDGFTVYRVRGGRGGYEWATIAVRGWTTPPDPMCGGQRRECGEILIRSSFGSWGHQWGHLGTPFLRWLLRAEFGYVFTKFMASGLRVFDGEATVREMRLRLIERRKRGNVDKVVARAVWDELAASEGQAECSDRDFIEAMGQIFDRIKEGWSPDTDIPEGLTERQKSEAERLLQEPWERIATKDHPQAVGFWRELWPPFIEYLRAELSQATAATDQPGTAAGTPQL